MATKGKYKRHAHHFDGFDFSQVMQFMKDNPELMKMAGSLLSQQGGGQQQQQPQQPQDYGVTGQKQTWSGGTAPFSNEIAGIANLIGGLSDKGNIPVEEAMGLPGNYYSCGGRLYPEGGGMFGSFGGGDSNSAMGYVNAAFDGVTNILGQAKGVEVTPYIKKAKTFGNQQVTANDNAELLNAWQGRTRLNNIDKYDITGGNLGSEILGRFNQNVAAADKGFRSTGNWIGAVIGGVTDLIGQGINIFNTSKNMKKLNRAIDVANVRQDKTYNEAAANISENTKNRMLANFSAFGGPIRPMRYGYSMPVMGATSYDIAKDNAYAKQMQVQGKNSTSFSPVFGSMSTFADGGGIHIAPSKRGTFTAAAKKHGKSVQEFASQVLANPDNYSPAMRKKANFARNAAKWHADGGLLLSDYFTNGVTLVDQGGTHENNPHEGVQMGIAPDGAPNLVEEGEAIFNDYVFSNRLVVPKEVRNKYKLRGPKDMTFAEAFREVQKESAERPNDPISQDGLDNMAMILARTQEAVRSYEKGHKKSKGGHLFSGTGNPYGFREVVENDVEENDNVLNNFWKSKLGDKWEDPKARLEYMNNDPNNPANTIESKGNGNLSGLRYAEPLANYAAVASDLLGLTNTPYEYDYIPSFQSVSYNPLGNYIPVTHFDTRYASNRAAQQAAATRNAIMQSTSPNKYAALLAADYNAQIAEGDLLRQAALDDYNMMVRREEFNRGTNQANSEMGLKAAIANQDAKLKYAQAALQEAKMNVDETNAASAARAANLSALAESVANIGREADARGDRNWLMAKGVFGTFSEDDLRNKYGFDEATIRDIKGNKYVGKNAACGGKIRRKKKGLTY